MSEENQRSEELFERLNKNKKKRKHKVLYTVLIVIAVIVAALVLLVLSLRHKVEQQFASAAAEVQSYTVQTGTISTLVSGSGILTQEDLEQLTVPAGVEITEVLVESGDTVKQGDLLATVDMATVMTALSDAQDQLDELDSDIADAKGDTVSSFIRSGVSGRVKILYAQPDMDVSACMAENGALAVLSLDGYMAVDLETSSVTTGDAVQVTLSDGTEVTGRVETCLNGAAVVTVEDEGYAMGETATVTAQDGSQVGSGELYIHNAWKATAYTGMVSTVWAKEESTVSSGASLFSLTGTEYTAQLDSLASQHREYEQQLQELSRMDQEGTINALCDGLVSGVDADSPYLLAAEETPLTASLLANTGTEWTIVLLSSVEEGEPTEATEAPIVSTAYTGYAGIVTGVGIDGLLLSVNETPYTVTQTEDGLWDLSQVNLDPSLMLERNVPFTTSETSAYTVNDIVVLIYDETSNFLSLVIAQKAEPEPTPTDPIIPPEASEPAGEEATTPTYPGGIGDLSGLGGLMGGSGMSGMGGASAAEPEAELYDLNGSVLMTVTTQDSMTLSITVDEQDISRVAVGQSAEVEVAALRGQVFEAEVTGVANIGTNSGGSSKFTVELTLGKSGNMLSGMSATATIPLYTKMDIRTVPVAALTEEGTATVVYTSLDQETGELTNPVEVTVGISDGETAELLSGLNSGDSFYYFYYDTLELSEEVEPASYSFGRKNRNP